MMWKEKKAVIFDLDGTVVDSMWMWRSIDREYLGKFGIPLPEDLQKNISGMSFSETAVYFKETFHLPDEIEKIKSDWNDMAMYKYTHEVPLKKGIFDFLKQLKAAGIRTGIATSNSLELVSAVLKSLGIRDYFDEVHTACEVAKGKPAPDIYLLVAECLKVRPEECLVFEDIEEGILAGKQAGMEVCAVEDEFSAGMREEKKRLADYFIMDYTELLSTDGK
ncbi:MAG: HAD family hydrolase [Lachnospiraceae bacterium]